MKKKVYKYKLSGVGVEVVKLPVGAEILTVQWQGDGFCLWALVDPGIAPNEGRIIEMFGTGSAISYGEGTERKYISTVQVQNGDFVLHFFELVS